MKLQTCWLILEHYGYDEKLRIDEKHLVSIKVKEEEIEEKWEGVELSDSAIEYLIKLFGIYASQDATIDQEGIDQIFQTAVDGCPWDIENDTKTQRNGRIDKNAWIALWQKTLCDNYEKAYEIMVYIGYCESFDVAVKIHRDRKDHLLSQNNNSVYNWYVIGDSGVGKSSLIDMFLKEQVIEDDFENDEIRSVVVPMQINNKEKYLILTEFEASSIEENLLTNRSKMNYCDLFCLVHDGTENSQRFIEKIHLKLSKYIPKVLIRAKSDVEMIMGSVPAEEIANEIKTSKYKEISTNNLSDVREAIDLVAQTAMRPANGLEHHIVEQLRQEEAQKNKDKQMKYGVLGKEFDW